VRPIVGSVLKFRDLPAGIQPLITQTSELALHRAGHTRDHGVFDAGSVVTASTIDGVHLDSGQHLDLGKALTELVQSILTTQSNEG
jgi:hypothetical protein